MDKLKHFWQHFISVECDAEKKLWLELFIYECEKANLFGQHCTIDNRFLSSIASHLTSYLLNLIYTTICASISLTNNKPINCNDPTRQNDIEYNCPNYDHGVCLSENGIDAAHISNDLTQIVALRKFFLDGLGGKILRVLHRVVGTTINGSREFCNVLINIMPTAAWTKTIEPEIDQPLLTFSDYLRICRSKDTSIGTKFAVSDDTTVNFGVTGSETRSNRPEDYVTDDFLAAIDRPMPFNQYGPLVLDLLYDLILAESPATIDANSMTVQLLRFGIDTLKQNMAETVFREPGPVKSKLLSLVVKTLQNLIDAGKLDSDFVEIHAIFEDLFVILQSCTDITSQQVLFFTLVHILDSLEINERLLETFRTKSTTVLSRMTSAESTKVLIDEILKILKRLKQDKPSKVSFRKRKLHKKTNVVTIRKCHHEFLTQPLACALETILFAVIPSLRSLEQVKVLKAMQVSANCCCSVTMANIDNLLRVYLQSGCDARGKYLTFIKNQLLFKVFDAATACGLCEQKRVSAKFQRDLLVSYKQLILESNIESVKLYVLLEHLNKLVKVLAYETLLHLIADCVLPVFRKYKACYFASTNGTVSERLILACLRLFTTCLTDLRLVKAFFNAENIEHLTDLSMLHQFAPSVCRLLMTGLQHQNFLGDASCGDQPHLAEKLQSVVLTNTASLTSSIIEMFNDFDHHFVHLSLLRPPATATQPQRSHNHIPPDSIKQLLMMNIIYWNTIFQLARMNDQFKRNFQRCLYAYYKERKILFILVYNSMKCYLAIGSRQLLNGMYGGAPKIDEDYADDDEGFFIVEPDYVHDNNNLGFVDVGVQRKPVSVLDVAYDIKWNCEPTNCDELLSLKSDCDHLKKLNYSDVFGHRSKNGRCDTTKPIFCVKSGRRRYVVKNSEWNVEICESVLSATIKPLFCSQTQVALPAPAPDNLACCIQPTNDYMKKFLDTLSAPQKSVGRVNEFLAKSIWGSFFVSPNSDSVDDYEPSYTKEQLVDVISGDGSFLKYLLLLFEILASNFMQMGVPSSDGSDSSMCSSVSTESGDVFSNNMDTALEQLRALITSHSIQYWHSLDNGIAILNALQALLKVAESRNSCCPSKFCSVSEGQNEEGGDRTAEDPRCDVKLVDVYASSSHTSCDYMLKSLQQTAAECYESDIENSDDNETVEELYQTADEGYDADAEAAAVTFNEPSESDETGALHSAYCPASNFRNRVVYDNLCKIVVEILFDLSQKCLLESTFWPALLTQLANRLAMVCDSIGGSKFLLTGFQPVLESNDVWLQDFQRIVLELITDLSTPEACSAYLSLFASPNPPVDLLLARLSSLWAVKLQPSIEVEFPSAYAPTISASCDPLILQNIKSIHDYHEHFNVRSAITEACNIVPLNQLNFKPWHPNGFTVSTWLCVKDTRSGSFPDNSSNTSANNVHDPKQTLTHLFSIGTEKLLFSVYLSNQREIFLKLTKPNADLTEKRAPFDTFSTSSSESSSADLKRQAVTNEFMQKKSGKRKVLRTLVPPYSDVKMVGVTETVADANKENVETGNGRFRKPTKSPEEGLNVLSDTRTGPFQQTKVILRNSFNKISLFSPTKLQPDGEAGVDLLRRPIKVKNSRLPKNRWSQLCVAVEPNGKSLSVTITFDGVDQQSLDIECPVTAYASKSSKLSLVCIGANDRPFKTEDEANSGGLQLCYTISNLLIFKQSLPNQVILSNLFAFGPECCSLMRCQLDTPLPNLGLLNFKKLSIVDDFRTREAVRSLQAHLIAIYSSHRPNLMLGNRDGDHEGLPMGLVTFGNAPQKRFVPSYYTAIYLAGGLQTILFLFARVVELSDSAAVQSSALHLLLRIGHSNAEFYTEFVRRSYLSLIFLVIKHEKCVKSVEMLKAILDVALDAPILSKRGDNEPYQVIANSNACIVYPELLLYTLRNYSTWSNVRQCDSDVLDVLLGVLLVLVREKHPQQELNAARLTNSGLITILLNFCKIHLVLVTNPIYISQRAAESLVTLIATLAGAPPSANLLDEIIKLLILMHRPSDSFITHDRSKFYFLLVPGEPTTKRPGTPKRLNNSLKIRDRKSSGPPLIRLNAAVAASEGNLYTKSSVFSVSSGSKEARHSTKNLGLDKTLTLSTDSTPSHRSDAERDWEAKLNRILLQNQPKDGEAEEQKRLKNKFNLTLLNDTEADQLNDALSNLNIKRQINLKSVTRKNQRRTISRLHRKRSSESEKEEMSGSISESGIEEDFNRKSTSRINMSSGKESDGRLSSPESSGDDKFSMYLSSGSIYIQEGLFNLLRDFILILPDNVAQEVLKHYVTMDILLVIASHNNEKVRAAILRLFDVIVNRLPTTLLAMYTRNNFWLHLGNQIALYPADFHLVQACMQWITGTNVLMDLQPDAQELPALNVEQKYGFNVLMAVLPGVLSHKQLSVVALEFLRRIYEDNPESGQYMLDNGLLATLVKVVSKLYGKFQAPDEQIVDGVCRLASFVAHRAMVTVGAINVLWDLLNGLAYVEQTKTGNVKRGCRIVQSAVLYNLLQSCINNNVDTVRTSTSIFGFKTNRPATIQILGCQLSVAEMKTRFDLIFDRAVQFIVNVSATYKQTPVEIRLIESVLQLVMNGHSKGGNVLIWSLCPARPMPLKLFVVRVLEQFTKAGSSNLNALGCDVKMLTILAQSMLLINREAMGDADLETLTDLCNTLGGPQNCSWNLDQALERIDVMRESSSKECKSAIERSVFRNEAVVQACVDTAMRTTREFVEIQNSERRTLMNFMRSDNDNYAINEWNSIVNRLTHDGAPWFNQSNSKNAWQLDDTEGPDRVRIRQKACHLKIEQRFMLNIVDSGTRNDQPILGYLTSMKRNENLSLSDQVLYAFNVRYVTVEKEVEGEIIITGTEFLFIETNDHPGTVEQKQWINSDIASISEIWPRRYQLNDNSLEVFFESKRSLFFVFKNLVDRDMMLKYFADKVVQSPDTPKLSLATQQWREGLISNWEYLSLLNQMSGRTYHDLMQYPIFPWILADYDSCILNMLDPKNFRKLDRPIAVQSKDMESHYINNYNYLLQSVADGGTTTLMRPYHYGSHYSNSGTVLHFLVRILPYTTLFLNYQDNNFDIPDRTFHSLQTTWRLASKDSPTDVKELIPEFFCLPEMFENNEGFNFGYRQSGEPVHHIALPPWCQNSARIFTFVHRQALESDIVRANLNGWIDLIFGFKQSGQAAVDAINVFHPATYHNFDIANIEDVVERRAFETMVRTYGQMPKKLLKAPHPLSKLLQWPGGGGQESAPSSEPTTPVNVSPPVMSTVIGLKWGRYTGSPQLREPRMIDFFQQFEINFHNLVRLEATNVMYGVPEKCNIMRGCEVDTLNLVAWGELDDVVRIKALSDDCESTVRHLLHIPKIDAISACGTSPDSTQLWLGHTSGRITVYQCYSDHVPKHYKTSFYEHSNKLSYNSAIRKFNKGGATKTSSDFERLSLNDAAMTAMRWTAPVILVKHTDEITGIQLSTSFKVVVSIGRDGIIAIWDMNKLEYIRSIEPSSCAYRYPLTHLTISPTLGDIVSVYSLENNGSTPGFADVAHAVTESYELDSDDFVKVSMNLEGKSQLRLHTINARYVNHLTLQARITAVCYSSIKEGTGVNVVAVAFENGHINLYSSWNLNFVREIDVGKVDIQSILYSTYQYLVILTKDNVTQVWESAGLQGNQPKFPQIVFAKRRSV